ncbi:MAG: HD domain-containing protein [Lachnospiraceae bacterium]|nr:HD domain-containing protein [Lachnospiraceae bacterium]
MFDLIRTYQLDIMLGLSAACMSFTLLLFFTRFLEKRRKMILIGMEFIATLLLFSDRMAYIYSGLPGYRGYVMVRVSNFLVFFLTSAIVFEFNLYLMDLLVTSGIAKTTPRRLEATGTAAVIGMFFIVLSQFTGLVYYFDDNNRYHRGPAFLLSYLIPVVCPLVQYTVIRKYRRALSRLIYTSLVLYIFVPIAVGIIQIFSYGISIVNMAMVLVSISLYIFTYLDVNEEVMKAHRSEMEDLNEERNSAKRLFDQTATAFVAAIEKRDAFLEGHSERVAEYAKRIAGRVKKGEDECDEIYYAALLHDVGMIGMPDSILSKTEKLSDEERRIMRQKPEISAEILGSISEYPYLKEGVLYSHEKYNGSGYPKGLKGKEIPEIARIITVADAYDTMTSRQRYRDPLPYPIVREEFVGKSGIQFDPEFAEAMIQIMDEDNTVRERAEMMKVESELKCGNYRDSVSVGIPVTPRITEILFDFIPSDASDGSFCSPAVILFDSYDRLVHTDNKSIDAYCYLEYGELWFDGHYVSTGARDMEVDILDNGPSEETDKSDANGTAVSYHIKAARYDDHMTIRMLSPAKTVNIIVALPDKSKSSYIGLTGENGILKGISIRQTDEKIGEGDIKKIVSGESFIDRLESDIPNVQIDRDRSDATEGIRIEDEMRVDFHTMTLPSASLIWHCPYVVIYYSEDGKVYGKGYREYALIKINGECTGDETLADNRFTMKKNDDFPGWDTWKAVNKEGMECSVEFVKKGNKVTMATENLGIYIENTTVISDGPGEVYAALTGDQTALTDIRIRKWL